MVVVAAVVEGEVIDVMCVAVSDGTEGSTRDDGSTRNDGSSCNDVSESDRKTELLAGSNEMSETLGASMTIGLMVVLRWIQVRGLGQLGCWCYSRLVTLVEVGLARNQR
jgi:hypothetical protein